MEEATKNEAIQNASNTTNDETTVEKISVTYNTTTVTKVTTESSVSCKTGPSTSGEEKPKKEDEVEIEAKSASLINENVATTATEDICKIEEKDEKTESCRKKRRKLHWSLSPFRSLFGKRQKRNTMPNVEGTSSSLTAESAKQPINGEMNEETQLPAAVTLESACGESMKSKAKKSVRFSASSSSTKPKETRRASGKIEPLHKATKTANSRRIGDRKNRRKSSSKSLFSGFTRCCCCCCACKTTLPRSPVCDPRGK